MAEDLDINLDDIVLNGESNSGQDSMSDDTSSDIESSTTVVDEHDIKIGDENSPIVILFGPPSCGKSMTLVRLARYLRKQHYSVMADPTFKPDAEYRKRCKIFEKNLDSKNALESTHENEFLMAKVVLHGRTICQLLEAPGEDFYKTKNPEETKGGNFRPYLTKIVRKLRNRKIWIFIAEANWEHQDHVDRYVERIASCKNLLMKKNDRAILLYNMIDRKEELFVDSQIMMEPAEDSMKAEYIGLADIFPNKNPFTSLWRKYNYIFVPFCTGSYHDQLGTNLKRYEESEDDYPERLWNVLLKAIKG